VSVYRLLPSLEGLIYFEDGEGRDTPVDAIHLISPARRDRPVSLTLEAIAERVVWWKPPAQALADQRYFLAHVMTSGTFDEVRCVRGHFPPEAFRAAGRQPVSHVARAAHRTLSHLALSFTSS
jgi:hypothetical protein